MTKVEAQVVRDPVGVCRIYCKRAKYKHWFELGRHAETDAMFERALEDNRVHWNPKIVDRTKLFEKFWIFFLEIKKLTLYLPFGN